MNVIDWKLANPVGEPLNEHKLIQEVKLTILDRGFKHFEQAPLGTSTSDHMDSIIDLAPWALNKFVFGWYSWGLPIDVVNDVWMWTPHKYINWRRNYLRPEIGTPAIRIWLYEGVVAHADVNYYFPASVSGAVMTPGTVPP